ncbi:MAG: general stress protein [Anaerolineae bacterium]|nr:general stress protein [Gloeobacterales cyanobacterium ES-bin-313]
MENQLRRGTNVPTDMAPGSVAVGAFNGMAAAEEAIHELAATGFSEEHITVAVLDSDVQKEIVEQTEAESLTSSSVATGGMGGALIEGLARLIGGKRGAANMVYSSLIHLGFSERQAQYYEAEYETGKILVVVEGGTRTEEARAILVDHGSALEPSLNADLETKPSITTVKPDGELQSEVTTVPKPQPKPVSRPLGTPVETDEIANPNVTIIEPSVLDKQLPTSAVGSTVVPGVSTDPARPDELYPAQF